jgi:predicted GTPase
MGYSKMQLEDLAATIAAVPCDSIIVATPVDLARLISLPEPYCRVRYELEEVTRPDLAEIVSAFVEKQIGCR